MDKNEEEGEEELPEEELFEWFRNPKQDIFWDDVAD